MKLKLSFYYNFFECLCNY